MGQVFLLSVYDSMMVRQNITSISFFHFLSVRDRVKGNSKEYGISMIQIDLRSLGTQKCFVKPFIYLMRALSILTDPK
ncbi:hypothetical protein PM8797T_23239 [Gimesia maris DSM 8797]|nr:hypothetical protein PM8797T_23239 [Gimesia maris DSM 8797]